MVPDFVRLGFTAATPLPNQGFPARFLGAPKAITATAHKLARLIYSTLRYGQDYVDAGAEYYESQYQQRALRAAKRRASQLGYQLGYQLVPMSDATGVPLNPPAAVA